MTPAETIILGAGLTGLSAAYHLHRTPLVLEKEDRTGGLCRSHQDQGFTFDRTGHWLHLRHPWTQRLAADLLGDTLTQVERESHILSHGVLTPYPFQANTFGLPPAIVKECLMGFVQALCARDQGDPPQNFEDWILYHFGPGIARHFMVPYNTKLWGVPPKEITSLWCDRFVPKPSLEEVIDGALGLNAHRLGYNVTFLYPRSGGIEAFLQAFAAQAPPVLTSTAPQKVLWREKRLALNHQSLPYSHLISTIPLPQLVALLDPPPQAIADEAHKLRFTSLLYYDVAVRGTAMAGTHWIYVPENQFPFYRVGSFSNACPSSAPPGHSALYVELTQRSTTDEDALARDTQKGLVQAGIIAKEEDVLFMRLRTIPCAYVIFDHNFYRCRDAIQRFLEEQAILSVGRYGEWKYASMEDALVDGRDVAERINRKRGR